MENFIYLAFWVFIGWLCWRLFLRDWVSGTNVGQAVKGQVLSRRISDEAYYEQAAHEVKNDIISEGLWAKAWSDANGDDTKARALYLKYRVDALRKSAAQILGK